MRLFTLATVAAFMAGLFLAVPALAEQQKEQVQVRIPAERLNSDQIRQVQSSLRDHGIDPGPADGKLGSLTRQGIQLFQQRQGLAATGNLNEQTLESLGLDPQEFLGLSRAQGQGQAQQRTAMQNESHFQVSLNLLNPSQVRTLQQQLKNQGIDPGPVDGVAGPLTKQGVQIFQQRQGLAATGNLNQQTLDALDIEAQEFMGLAPAFK